MIKISEDLVLKPLAQEYAPLLFSILDSERAYMRVWLPFVDKTKVVNDTENAVAGLVDGVNNQYCIFDKDEFVGLVGFKDTDNVTRKTEIGYWLSQKAQGKGIMTQSVLALLDIAFNKQGMNRVQIKAAVGNNPSRAIPERLGFELEGIERDGELLVDDKYTDLAIYSLLQKEFKRR